MNSGSNAVATSVAAMQGTVNTSGPKDFRVQRFRHCLAFALAASWALFLLAVLFPVRGLRESGALGLLSSFPWPYWLALALAIGAAIGILEHDLKEPEGLLLALAITIAVYLLSAGVLLEKSWGNPDTFQNYPIVQNIVSTGRVEGTGLYAPGVYLNWPASPYLVATMQLLGGVKEYAVLTRYLPVVDAVFLVLAAQCVGLRLGLSRSARFLVSILFVSTTVAWDDYPAMIIGQALYMIGVAAVLSPDRSSASRSLLVLPLLLAATIAHPLTSLAMLLVIGVFVAVGRASWPIMVSVVVAATCWYLYRALPFVETFIRDLIYWWSVQWRIYAQAQATARASALPWRLGWASMEATYAILVARNSTWVLFRRAEARGVVLGLVLAPLCVSVVALGLPLNEAAGRVLVLTFMWVLMLYALTRPARVGSVILMVILPASLLLIRYAPAVPWSYVTRSGLEGAQFFANHTQPTSLASRWFAYHKVPSLVLYYNPFFRHAPATESSDAFARAGLGPTPIEVAALNEKAYVLMDWPGHVNTVWFFGYDPFASWPSSAGGKQADLIYDSGLFQIFSKAFQAQPRLGQGFRNQERPHP